MEHTSQTSLKQIGCINVASEVLGDKWTPRLLRAFNNNGVMRFCQLQNEVGGVNPRTLSARLQNLESKKIIEKTPTSSDSRCEYRLTKKGADLLPIIEQMHAWSRDYGN
jgi:DNA-binding HxlR family transcriptional regulator